MGRAAAGPGSDMQDIDLKMKKQPRQARSKATVKAIIEGCAQVLAQQGYSALTTNEIARVAGVSIGSVYEYFPGKEAIVAAMVEDLLARNLSRLDAELGTRHNNSFDKAMRHWVGTLFRLVQENRALLQVLVFEVPYAMRLVPASTLQRQLLGVVMKGAARSRQQYRILPRPEVLYLIASLTAGALLSLAFAPPPGLHAEAILDELAARIVAWLVE